jgi:acetolactate synthase-1/2/3 large subunit
VVAEVLARRRVPEIYTLSGGHVFPIYDGCVRSGVAILDVRHEQTAVFAAEARAKLTRRPGVAVLTAGPGVTNGVSGLATAWFNGSPLVVLAGRAPQGRWGQGSLQELDHLPVVASLTKRAATVSSGARVAPELEEALDLAGAAHRGPVFLDFPLEVLYGPAGPAPPPPGPQAPAEADPEEVARAGRLLARASRPVLLAGGDVWWEGAEEALVALVEGLRVPTFTNGLGRGCLPADHPLYFSRTRPEWALADLVCVVGTPLDFRVGFGRFGSAQVLHVVDAPERLAAHVPLAAAPAGPLGRVLAGMLEAGVAAGPADHEDWVGRLSQEEAARRAAERAQTESAASPLHPARVVGELGRHLDPDAVVVGDGGDFVSFAGRLLDSYRPGCWLDPGPYGCLGTAMGYAAAARRVHPDRQVVALVGDGAAGFSLMDADTLVRHGLAVAIVVGNNGVWGLEKHPMAALYGYDVAADLQAGCRYDRVVAALGGAGETVAEPDQLGPALDRALASGVPYLVNVLCDPAVSYPRTSSLA